MGYPVCVDGAAFQAESPTRFRHSDPFIANTHEHVSSRVAVLLLSRCPSAITRLVVAICVNPVETIAVWSRTHVSQKRAEVTPPRLLNSDAPPAVERKGWIGSIQASTFRVLPRLVLSRDATVMFRSVTAVRLCGSFAMKTAATARVASAKILPDDHYIGAAIASTDPTRAPAAARLTTLYNQTADALTAHVDTLRHCLHVTTATGAAR